MTSSLQLTVASPWSFLALQEYTPPSKLPGLRISREQMPWTQICLNLGSSPIIIWFFIHTILGCGKKKQIYMSRIWNFWYVSLQECGNYIRPSHTLTPIILTNKEAAVAFLFMLVLLGLLIEVDTQHATVLGVLMALTWWALPRAPEGMLHVTPLPSWPVTFLASSNVLLLQTQRIQILVFHQDHLRHPPVDDPVGLWAQTGGERLRQRTNKARWRSHTFSSQSQAADK